MKVAKAAGNTDMKRMIALALVLLSSLALTGCPASLRGDTYSRGAALQWWHSAPSGSAALRPSTLR